MNKVPTLLLVAIISAGGGAGLMWLLTHGPGSTRALTHSRATDRPAKRPGIPEPFEPAPHAETPESGAKHVDPAVLRALENPPMVSKTRGAEAVGSTVQPPSGGELVSLSRSLPNPETRRAPPILDPRFLPYPSTFDKAKVDAALAAASRAASAFAEDGYTIRDEHWGGALGQSARAVQHQLFRGNDYWFWLGSDRADAGIDLHIYDGDGNLAESEHWQRGNVAAARVIPANTGSYYIILSSDRDRAGLSPNTPVHWGLVYGYR